MSFIVDFLHSVTTGPERRRRQLTPVGLAVALTLLIGVVAGSLWMDRALAVPPLLPAAMGASIGAVLLASGLALWGWSLVLFKGQGVPFNPPRDLVTIGPYAWVRNPMVLGLFTALFGLGCLLHSLSLVFAWLPALAIVNVIELKLVEEPELERRLGARYRAYRENVPMLVPKRPGGPESPGTSDRSCHRHRMWSWPLTNRSRSDRDGLPDGGAVREFRRDLDTQPRPDSGSAWVRRRPPYALRWATFACGEQAWLAIRSSPRREKGI